MATRGAPPLLAYLHMRPGTPVATPALLRDYIAGFVGLAVWGVAAG